MRITIAVHGHLRDTSAVGQDELTVSLPDAGGMRVRDLLDTLNIMEEEVGQVVLNGRRSRLDKTLQGRITLELFPKRR
jgi:hypothetical protein